MKLLTFAHRGEAQAFLAAYSFIPVEFFFDGLLKSDSYYLLITGEGVHSASEKTISVLAKYASEITHVYNIGVAGSLNQKLKMHDLVWIRTSYAHHAEKCEFKSYSSTHSKAFNDCMTAYSRVLSSDEKNKLSHFASVVDRELWAVGSAASLFKKTFSALKIISDELQEAEVDICKFVKEQAPFFSEKLLLEFKLEESISPSKKLNKELNKAPEFQKDSHFYFTISQERKLYSTIEGLRLNGKAIESLMKSTEIRAIKEAEKLPKERTRLLLQYLSEQLNPISVKIRASLEKAIAPLQDAKISAAFDSDFEEDWLTLSMKLQSSRDLEKIKNALKNFSYEDYQKIFNGHFDV